MGFGHIEMGHNGIWTQLDLHTTEYHRDVGASPARCGTSPSLISSKSSLICFILLATGKSSLIWFILLPTGKSSLIWFILLATGKSLLIWFILLAASRR